MEAAIHKRQKLSEAILVFLDDLNGDSPVDMESVFGLNSCCWHWYEE